MPDDGPLLAALAESQRLGMLGRLPVADVVAHSDAFVGALVGVTATVVDLGTGGGVPGLVIAWRRPDLSLVLADRRTTRIDHVSRLVHRLALADRVRVIPTRRGNAPPPVWRTRRSARSSPAGTATPALSSTDAVPLLAPGGLPVVSEPPTGTARWSDDLLAAGGLSRIDHDDTRVAVLQRGSSQ